nr:hypothetical protein [Neobacillus sp. Marseille-Q6967]
MSQRIGNVGLLNLVNATVESIKGIERIENVGMVLYRKETAHLLPLLSIGNIGASLEIPAGYRLFNGVLHLNDAYLRSIHEPVFLLVNGIVLMDKTVQPNQLKQGMLNLVVNGQIYCPTHLAGYAGQLLSKGSGGIETYDGALPRFENGKFTLTNSFLQSLDKPLHLVVNGLLSFEKDIEMDLFEEKIAKLAVNGKITIYEHQESFLYRKASSLAGCKIEVIPDGFQVLTKPLRLSGRSIRRFQNSKLFTNKPLMMEADVTRDLLSGAIAQIHSKSVVICSEEVEDLVYERLSRLETEVLSYENGFIWIDNNEVWSNEQFMALEKPLQFIVNGKLTFEHDVSDEAVRSKISGLDILGEVVVREPKLKGVLQNVIRLNTGTIHVEAERESGSGAALRNVGELSL